MTQVDSSHIASAGHDRTSNTLFVNFHDQSLYSYSDVLEGTYQALVTNKSPGSFFNQRIKGQFKSAKLKDPAPKKNPAAS